MKHIIIEGGDGLGKNSLIKRLTAHYDYDNVTIRHFNKPPSNLDTDVLDFQIESFTREIELYQKIDQIERLNQRVYENVVIWNRSYHGEYVYGSMFRDYSKEEIWNALQSLEKEIYTNPYFILLTADPEFFLGQEDGHSFSKNLRSKREEMKLFKEIFEKSNLSRKLQLQVNREKKFLSKEEIFKKVLNFIEEK